ncbi:MULTISPECIES: RluA family pseudouridine synthase [Galbibacter]|uniref:23S RNA-specific pseudouridylate synthase n=1 Tax=Galbibacter marinus TaxID=555500 RepID=K2PVK0_9FLAO|nr:MULTISPECIES: RluA family pseudouridine synthase [Galbibacter]EKF56700.1 23S RNA-specific pseudouridylate synthase [Galbibacter marinus]HLV63171.1 RluA family pseudouridine synthase [Galbibacter sp.]
MGIFKHAATKSALKKALKKQHITIDNIPVSSATYIYGGETIVLTTPLAPQNIKDPKISFDIIYEDQFLAAIVKPSGVLVSGNKFKTIANSLAHRLTKSDLPEACIAQPVHRLDFGTSGILLCGKTRSSIRELNKMFEHKLMSKSYYAITAGEMPGSGHISTPIDGKEALSLFQVIERIDSKKYNCLNLVKLNPKTGRRHQLRKHLAGINHPILGDRDYGIDHISSQAQGLYLHSYSLEFIHPFTMEKQSLIAPIPKRFKKWFKKAQY